MYQGAHSTDPEYNTSLSVSDRLHEPAKNNGYTGVHGQMVHKSHNL